MENLTLVRAFVYMNEGPAKVPCKKRVFSDIKPLGL